MGADVEKSGDQTESPTDTAGIGTDNSLVPSPADWQHHIDELAKMRCDPDKRSEVEPAPDGGYWDLNTYDTYKRRIFDDEARKALNQAARPLPSPPLNAEENDVATRAQELALMWQRNIAQTLDRRKSNQSYDTSPDGVRTSKDLEQILDRLHGIFAPLGSNPGEANRILDTINQNLTQQGAKVVPGTGELWLGYIYDPTRNFFMPTSKVMETSCDQHLP